MSDAIAELFKLSLCTNCYGVLHNWPTYNFVTEPVAALRRDLENRHKRITKFVNIFGCISYVFVPIRKLMNCLPVKWICTISYAPVNFQLCNFVIYSHFFLSSIYLRKTGIFLLPEYEDLDVSSNLNVNGMWTFIIFIWGILWGTECKVLGNIKSSPWTLSTIMFLKEINFFFKLKQKTNSSAKHSINV